MYAVPRLILASNSPRRRQLLALTGWQFEVSPADVDESPLPGEKPDDYVLRLATEKARVIASQSEEPALILAADTTVADGDSLLGKPESPDQAVEMLKSLRGHTHQVYTGLALGTGQMEKPITELCVTNVPMRDYSDEEVQRYVQSGDPLDKAGAYAIQHAWFHPVVDLQGCFASVMGLPLCHLQRSMARLGVQSDVDIPSACQKALNYTCPVWSAILQGENVG